MFRTSFNEQEKLWSGPAPSKLCVDKSPIGKFLLQAMLKHPERIAQINTTDDARMTYKELYTKSICAAQNLQKLNYKKGDTFALVSKNHPDMSAIMVALLSLGCPFNAVHPFSSESEIARSFAITQPTCVFSDADLVHVVARTLQSLANPAEVYVFGDRNALHPAADDLFVPTGCENQFVPAEIDSDNDLAVILCTSGSLERPKAVCLSHGHFLSNFRVSFGQYEDSPDEVLLSFNWISALSGILAFFYAILEVGTRLTTSEKFSADLMLHMIERYKVTFIVCAPHQSMLLLKSEKFSSIDLSNVKCWTITGDKTPKSVTTAIGERMPKCQVITTYGLTECGTNVALNFATAQTDAVGYLTPGMTVKIVDSDGNRLGVRRSGEILVKLPRKFIGYLTEEQNVAAYHDAEGFLRTGDIGYFDSTGLLYVIDRKKFILKYRAFPICPKEIEHFLVSLPEIKLACVVGVDDEVSGDLPAAFIVLVENATISEQEVYDRCAIEFGDAKKLRGGVYSVESLPLNQSGKIQRPEVKKLANALFKNCAF